MIREVVQYVDANFHTLSNRESRGIVGDYMGGPIKAESSLSRTAPEQGALRWQVCHFAASCSYWCVQDLLIPKQSRE